MGEKLKTALDAEKIGIASSLGKTPDISDEIEEIEVEAASEE